MLSYQAALKCVLRNSFPLKPLLIPLREALGHIAARDVLSPEPYPAFDNSAVDGYAVSIPSTYKEGEPIKLKVCGEIPAGKFSREILKPGEAIRIFTGAAIPRGTQAVVMQEDTRRINGTLQILKRPGLQEHIRFRGEDFQKGRILVRKRTVLNPTHLALLAAVGYPKVFVYPSPTVSVLATGGELFRRPVILRVPAGGRSASGGKSEESRKGSFACLPARQASLRVTLPRGKIRDSNSILLDGLVKKIDGTPHVFPSVGDEPREIHSAIRKGLKSDLLLISGGVSVGKYDFVRDILKEEGVREIFWKVDIKPGKPLFFGKKGRTLVFGLPGNPVSVFVTFEEFVKPAILRMRGREETAPWVWARMKEGFQNGGRLHFVRVRCVREKSGYGVTPLEGQGSHRIGTLALSNALLRVEPNLCLKRHQEVLVKFIGGN